MLRGHSELIMRFTFAIIVLTLVILISCANNPHYNPGKPHHTDNGFKNLHYDDSKGALEFFTWKWQQMQMDIPDADSYNFPVDRSMHDSISANTTRPSLTWIGHATFLIQINGMNILTDPQFSKRASPFAFAGPKRASQPGMSIDELPLIDVVVISHDHYDSLDIASLEGLVKHNQSKNIHFMVPLGLKEWFEELDLENIEVTELDWGERHTINNIQFTAEPAQHWGKRTLFDAFERLWASWVIEHKDRKIFFAGDSGYVQHFKEIGDKYGSFDLALIPIGAYEPRWFMKPYHINPEEAVMVHQDIRSKYSVGMHWGTFILTDEPLDEPPVKLAEALDKSHIPSSTFEVYRHGEAKFLDIIWD